MRDRVTRIEDGRDAVLARVGDNAYTRAMSGRTPLPAFLTSEVTAWLGLGPFGRVACAVGPLAPAATLLARLRATGELGDIRWLHLPHTTADQLAIWLDVRQVINWRFRWLAGEPLAHHPTGLVEPLGDTDAPAINAILDTALPHSAVRPGSRSVHRWYGIRSGGRLVACAADQSFAAVGVLGGIAVYPDQQGRGLGTVLTTQLARQLHERYGAVALGVMADNPRAGALYDRLGFTGGIDRASVEIN